MLHDFFPGSILSCARIWTFLTRIDAAEAERCRLEGCPRCGGCLDSASYPRKPHGLAASLREGVRRFSFCCRDCRRRETPSSVRFFGRRIGLAYEWGSFKQGPNLGARRGIEAAGRCASPARPSARRFCEAGRSVRMYRGHCTINRVALPAGRQPADRRCAGWRPSALTHQFPAPLRRRRRSRQDHRRGAPVTPPPRASARRPGDTGPRSRGRRVSPAGSAPRSTPPGRRRRGRRIPRHRAGPT